MTDTAGSILTIDLGAIAANYGILRDVAKTDVAAVVKANCYGLGIEHIVPALVQAGCREFFVGTIDEGIAVRALTDGAIYVFDGIHSGHCADLNAYRLTPVLNSLSDIEAWQGACVLHFDTGMNRLGLSAQDAEMLLADPTYLARVDVKLAMSHFACSDEKNHPLNAMQVGRFEALKTRFTFARWSLCNSSGIFRVDDRYDVVRPGYALYGGNPTPEAANPMRDVVRLDARVLQTRQTRKGETIGYGATYGFGEDAQTATLAFGYADGFHRGYGMGQVYYNGVACPILGRVSMDLVSVGIGHLADKPAAGAVMEVLGPHQGIDGLGASTGTIGYEILTGLGMRYARVYIKSA